MNKDEIIRIIDGYLNDRGHWYDFKEYVEEQGYSVGELGFKED